jgi:murein DD-endopeptidase MepM/ murein hydrolase activator NlpD
LTSKIRIVFSELGKGFSVIVAPRGTGTTVSFSVPGRLAIALIIVLGALLAGLAFSGYTYVRLTILAMDVGRLERENAVLTSQTQKIDEIRAEIAEVEKMRRQIESWAGMASPEVEGEEFAEGTEGAEGEDNAYVYVPMWPRRYSYEIMRDVYLYHSHLLPDMIIPAAGWLSRQYIVGAEGELSHPGVDIVAATGTPVRCALDGEITFAGWDEIYGNLVRIEHNDSISTVYGHNDEILVKEGERVAKGAVIARVGNTGRSTAPHLHFEVLKNGIAEDPELYVNLGHNKSQGN